VEEIHTLMKTTSETTLEIHLQYPTEPIISVDIVGNPYSAIYDASLTKVLRNNYIKITGWYDNESDYTNQVIERVQKMGHYELRISEESKSQK